MTQAVKVRLRKPRRVFTFLCEDIPLERDEPCIVQTDRGTEWGTCLLPPEPLPDEMARRFTMRVLRKANDEDAGTQAYLEDEEQKARRICAEKIRERNMPMKLVDVEYTFDKKKIVFYFTAENRVDFRELVRDLAHALRARIELRHIQVRDESKMVGGIGSCGRELCCSTWLNEFKPISMRMAKRQNLSLNPSKISGQCGRLLCCLSYENDQYESLKEQAKRRRPDKARQPAERGAPEQEPPKRQAVPERADVRLDDTAWQNTVPPMPVEEQKSPPEAEQAAPQGKGGGQAKEEGKKRKRNRRRRKKPKGPGGGKS